MYQLPVTIEFGTLPLNGLGYTPQEYADRLGINGRIFTEQAFALFSIGATAPTSDTGPWAKNGNEWYYWDDGTGSYVPFLIPSASLKYYVGNAAPDPTKYLFWIQLDGAGSPLALKTYYGAAWVDVYATTLATYATAAALTAGLAATLASAEAYTDAAIAGIPGAVCGTKNFKARNTVDQDIVFGGAGNQAGTITINSEDFDPEGVFGSDKFTCPATGYYTFKAGVFVSTTGAGGGDTLDTVASFAVNGTPVDDLNNPIPDTTSGIGIVGSTDLYLNAGDEVTLRYDFTASAAFTAKIVGGGVWFSGFRTR